MSVTNLNTDTSRALTFTVGDSLFGIDVSHILSFSDSFNEIKYSNDDVNDGFIGYLDFRNSLVKVYECATVLSKSKERDFVVELIAELRKYQQAHISWMSNLENSIVNDQPFTLARDPRACEFGKWFYSFNTDDESFRALLDKVEEPHIEIHSLADKFLDMAANGQKDAVIAELHIQKQTTLKKVIRLFDYIVDYLQNSIHPIVLHLTQDGRTPWYSLVLDDIGDIIDYPASSVDRNNSSDRNEPIEGYVRDPSGANFMMLSLSKFYNQVSENVSMTG